MQANFLNILHQNRKKEWGQNEPDNKTFPSTTSIKKETYKSFLFLKKIHSIYAVKYQWLQCFYRNAACDECAWVAQYSDYHAKM